MAEFNGLEKISVIIPTYNYGRYISEAIAAVLGQTLEPFEIIIVDDGSTDNTEKVVRWFGDRVRYIRQENAGVCAARNRGVAESSGDYIAFADADDIWHPTKLEKQIAKFAEDTKIGLVHCGMREFDSESREILAVNIDGMEGEVANEILLWERSVIIGPGGTILVSRKALLDSGGFDTNLTVGEDIDLCYRISKRYRVAFVPEVLVDYRSHELSAHLNVAQMERSTLIILKKAFDSMDSTTQNLRHRSYGNLYRLLAGSYLRVGDYWGFFRNSLKCLWHRPQHFNSYLKKFAFTRSHRN